MPELPEVETVRRTLEQYIQGRTIQKVSVYYEKILANQTPKEFAEKIAQQTIEHMNRKGKWLIFELTDYDLVSHLRMEGKYFLKTPEEERSRHEHVVFTLDDGRELRYHDTRKFGRMYLFPKGKSFQEQPLSEVGPEPWQATVEYLKEKLKSRKIPIKTVLLDQSVLSGIGNIYADEILFQAKIHPLSLASQLTKKDCQKILTSSQQILEEAISMGGTTIRSYESEKGVHGRFQQNLLVHNQENCTICKHSIERIFIAGRSTYFCKKCQKMK